MITTKNRKTHCEKTYNEWEAHVFNMGRSRLELAFFQLLRDYFHLKAHIPEEKPEKTYKVGDKFLVDGITTYLLAQVNTKAVSLVDVDGGNRWSDPPVEVKYPHKITEEEFKKLLAKGDIKKWVLKPKSYVRS